MFLYDRIRQEWPYLNGKRSYGGGYMLLSSYTESYVDENGVIHTYTYTDYSNGGHPPLDKGDWIVLIFSVLVVTGLSVYHFYRAYKAALIKKVCVEQIPALVVRIDSSRSDDNNYRYRYKRYNATYRYDYNGRTYSCRHRLWGSRRALGDLKTGVTSVINICPGQPEIIYDRLAESARKDFFSTGVVSAIGGIMIILMIVFRRYL